MKDKLIYIKLHAGFLGFLIGIIFAETLRYFGIQ